MVYVRELPIGMAYVSVAVGRQHEDCVLTWCCDVCDWSCLPSSWLSSHGDYSATAPAAPSSRPHSLSSSLIRCQLVQVYHHHHHHHHDYYFRGLQAEVLRVGNTPVSLALKLCAVSSFTWEVAGSFMMSLHLFSTVQWKTWLLASPSPVQWFVWGPHKMSPCSPDTGAVSGLGPLCHCCILVAPNISSQASVLSGFLVQHCPYLLLDSCVPCAVQEQHSRLSICRQWPTSSWTHHRPRSVSWAVSGALQPDAGPHTGPSELWQFPLHLR
jgi:hypothetical protein